MKELKIKNNLKNFLIEFDRESDKRWIAEISNLPGVMAYGLTKQEALRKVCAIALHTLADGLEQGRSPYQISQLFNYEMAVR
ncbi:MAG: type II toxin-antitoxin system HicB family antitoxin [Patescibacteria group bacterium]